MSSISDTIERLAALRGSTWPQNGVVAADRLSDMLAFGSNPGALRPRTFVPGDLAPGSPLVVVLHGCTQTAVGYDLGSGWSRLAQEHGFALLLPEQARSNNPNLCFNWFSPEDARRGQGEAASIRQMIEAMVERHDVDRGRVFITGLSAGGAMTAVMLATYPEVFAGGAVIAGLPYGTAWSVQQALGRMRGQGLPGDEELGALVRGASDHDGAWPTLSVWHGDVDATVSPVNADAILQQWRALHGTGLVASDAHNVGGHRRRAWRNEAGLEVVEDNRIAGMGHGTPIAAAGADRCGASGPHMLDVGVPSTRLIAQRWGLVPAIGLARPGTDHPSPPGPGKRAMSGELPSIVPMRLSHGIEQTIGEALRAAGLLR